MNFRSKIKHHLKHSIIISEQEKTETKTDHNELPCYRKSSLIYQVLLVILYDQGNSLYIIVKCDKI